MISQRMVFLVRKGPLGKCGRKLRKGLDSLIPLTGVPSGHWCKLNAHAGYALCTCSQPSGSGFRSDNDWLKPHHSGVAPANQTKESAKTKSSWISPIFVNSGVFPWENKHDSHIELLFRNAPAKSSWTDLSLVWFAGATPESSMDRLQQARLPGGLGIANGGVPGRGFSSIDEGQITHLICARLKYDLYDFLRGCFWAFSTRKEQEAGPKHP